MIRERLLLRPRHMSQLLRMSMNVGQGDNRATCAVHLVSRGDIILATVSMIWGRREVRLALIRIGIPCRGLKDLSCQVFYKGGHVPRTLSLDP